MNSSTIYWTPLASIIAAITGIEMTPSRIELSFMLYEWSKLHPAVARVQLVSMFKTLAKNEQLLAYMLGVAPSANEAPCSGGLLLHNLIEATRPEAGVITDKGCGIIYDHCGNGFRNIPVQLYRPNIEMVTSALSDLETIPSAPMQALAESVTAGFIDLQDVLSWASKNPDKARRIDSLTLLLSSCALISNETTADNVDLCISIADETGRNIYPYDPFCNHLD